MGEFLREMRIAVKKEETTEKDVSLGPKGHVNTDGSPFGIQVPLGQPPSGDRLNILSLRHPEIVQYAVTINICPDKFINRRKWRLYTHDQQRKILLSLNNHCMEKVFSYLEDKHPATYDLIYIKEIRFEVCPTLQQVHFHALIETDELSKILYLNRWQTYNVANWRISDCQEIYDEEGWVSYINKMNAPFEMGKPE